MRKILQLIILIIFILFEAQASDSARISSNASFKFVSQ